MISLIEGLFVGSTLALATSIFILNRRIQDLKESVILISRNPTRARREIKKKYKD